MPVFYFFSFFLCQRRQRLEEARFVRRLHTRKRRETFFLSRRLGSTYFELRARRQQAAHYAARK